MRTHAVSRTQLLEDRCSCHKAIGDDPPVYGDFAIDWEDGFAWEQATQKYECRRMEQEEHGKTVVDHPSRRWLPRRRSTGTQSQAAGGGRKQSHPKRISLKGQTATWTRAWPARTVTIRRPAVAAACRAPSRVPTETSTVTRITSCSRTGNAASTPAQTRPQDGTWPASTPPAYPSFHPTLAGYCTTLGTAGT